MMAGSRYHGVSGAQSKDSGALSLPGYGLIRAGDLEYYSVTKSNCRMSMRRVIRSALHSRDTEAATQQDSGQ
jgi:hypothetical protein